ncbi:MAG: lysophospholipid acyltransferase family protein [Bacteroidetes bacterium]|nr:lysophospholipid acyltransferase family protein [Bacteroidota bacterium]
MDLIKPQDLLSSVKPLKYLGGDSAARFMMKTLKLNVLNDRYNLVSGLKEQAFIDKVIEELGFTFEIPEEDLANIPKEGPFISIHNHPYGGLDGILLIKLLGTARPDFKILVNFLLTKIQPVESFFLPVNPFETHKDVRSSYSGLKEAFSHLSKGFPLGIYPAGEVSSYQFDKKKVTDRNWQLSVIKFIKKAQVPILPVYFEGHNSRMFQILGMIHPLLRTAKLPSELFNKEGKKVRVRIGTPIPVKDQDVFSDINDFKKFLRTKTYSLGLSDEIRKSQSVQAPRMEDIIAPVNDEDIIKEVESIRDEFLLFNLQGVSVFCVPSSRIPNVLREIGRLREVTYREVGEGTNKSLDLDSFDDYYEQLFIWDDENHKIVGGYRAGKGKDILPQHGIKGFYVNTLFRVGPQMIPILNETIELGRSFVTKEYQKKTYSLFLLWKGILYLLLKHPEYRYLIGPVSISNTFSDLAKALTVEFMKSNYYNFELAEYIRPKKTFKAKINPVINRKVFLKHTENDVAKLDRFIQDFEPVFRTPILLKKYINLNAEIIGFNVDPKFNYCLDGLMILDLLDVPMNTIESLSKELDDKSILERFKK